jgi:MFS family permease
MFTAERVQLPGAARVVLAGNFINALGTGLVLPFLLVYLHDVRHISLPATGLLMALPGLVGFVAGPLGGLAADRLGAQRILVGGCLLEGLAALLLATVRGPGLAAPVLLLLGAGNATFFPAQSGLFARLADGAVLQRLFAVNFVLLNAGIGVGGIVAGLAVSTRHPGTFQVIYLADGLTTLIYAVAVAAIRVHGPRTLAGAASGSYREVFAHPLFPRIVGLSALLALVGYVQVDSGLPAFVTVTLGLPPRAVAAALVLNTAVIVTGQLLVLRRIERWRRTRALVGTAAVWAAAWLLLGSAALIGPHDLRWLVVVAFGGLFGLGETFMAPTVAPMTNDVAPDHLRGRFFAMTALTYSLGFTLGPPIATTLIARHLAGLWLALLIAGCGLLTYCAIRLEQRLSPAQNGALALERDGELQLMI